MGITSNSVKFLFYAKRQGASFDKTLMLGRQQLFATVEEINGLSNYFGFDHNFGAVNQYAEPLFELLGATTIDSIDYSDFEGATFIHDLNFEIQDKLKNAYTVVFDGGTLEHVFNFPIAIKNCMDLLKIGGTFISVTPTNNHCGHGFYQFSPELFFSVFDKHHGFKIKLVAVGVEHPLNGITEWYAVKNPKDVKDRVTLSNCFPTSLLIIAEKISDTTQILLHPFQSDYQHIWEVHDSIEKNIEIPGEAKWIHLYRRWMPDFIKAVVRRIRKGSQMKQFEAKNLGFVNTDFFTKIDI